MKNLLLLMHIAIWLTLIMMLMACRTQKEVVQDTSDVKHLETIVKHDTVRVERHRVDSIYRHDSIFVSQAVKNDTVFVEKHYYHTCYQRESETKKDSAKVVEEEKKEDAETLVKKEESFKRYPVMKAVAVVMALAFVAAGIFGFILYRKYK